MPMRELNVPVREVAVKTDRTMASMLTRKTRQKSCEASMRGVSVVAQRRARQFDGGGPGIYLSR